jgi:hypothetical protein
MNIFYLHNDPKICAEMHTDKHVIKMILEYAQLLSTAHRVLDGTPTVGLSKMGRKKTSYVLSDFRDTILYSATHLNHPSAIWARLSKANYQWLHSLLIELCKEYTYRYGKVHLCERSGLVTALSMIPKKLETVDRTFDEPFPAMPDEVKVPGNSIQSYRNYYINNKQHLASWRGKVNSRPIPEWFHANV